MPNRSLDDLPILRELRDDLEAAFRTHEAEAGRRDALAQPVTEVLARAHAWLGQTHHHHHPHSPRARIGLALAGAAGIAAATAIVLSIVGLGAATQRASAEWSRWTPAPTPAAQGQTATAERACLARTPGVFSQSALLGPQPAPWHVLVADTRGPFTLVLLQSHNRNAFASCLAAPSGAHITGGGAGYPGGKPPALAAGQIKIEDFGAARFPPAGPSELGRPSLGHPYSHVAGQVGAGVSGVKLVLRDGERVIPTIANGWFLAWWPSFVPVLAAEVTTAHGTSTRQLYNPLITSPVMGSGSR